MYTKTLFALLFLVFIPFVKSQIQGCPMQNIDIGQRLIQGNSYPPGACCNALNQVTHTGFSCMCSLLASSLPLSSFPILLPLPNCHISLLPLSLCRGKMIPRTRSGNLTQHPAPSLDAVVPQAAPPNLSPAEDQMQSPLAAVLPPLPLPSADDQMQSSLHTTGESNSTAVPKQPCSGENAVPKLDSFGGEEKTKILMTGWRLCFSLVILLLGSILLA